MKCIDQYIQKYISILNQYFSIEKVDQESCLISNPLVVATDLAENALTDGNPNPYSNSNQLIRLDENFPFYRLIYNK